MIVALAVAAAGGLGAVLRYLLTVALRPWSARFPWSIAVVNVSGSFLLGVVVAMTSGGVLPEPWPPVLGAGLLGGFTTFSTASEDTRRLVQQRHPKAAFASALGVLLIGVLAAATGLVLGSRVAA